MNDLTTLIFTGILSGGTVGGASSWITGRAMARKNRAETDAIRAKVPVEVDSVVVQGAEQAVLTMQRALQAAEKRITQLEKQGHTDHRTIAALREEVAQLRDQLAAAAKRAGDLEQRVDALDREHRHP